MVYFGLSLYPEYATWAEMREGALLVDQLGYDGLFTSDHFIPSTTAGHITGPNLEGWQVLPAWGAMTYRVQIGMLVTGNTYRHPAILAKMVATLDHITGGRAVLGLGAGWYEAEHRMYGLDFGTLGQRMARLAESAAVVRSLLDRPRTTFHGKHYRLTDALAEPKPVQRRLPLLIGGAGERKTLRVVARHADMWHRDGSPELIAHRIEVLKRHCEAVGRDVAEILPLAGGAILVRDDAQGIEVRMREWTARGRIVGEPILPLAGTPATIAAYLAAQWRAGARGWVFYTSAPYDRETIELLQTEVRPRLMELIGGEDRPWRAASRPAGGSGATEGGEDMSRTADEVRKLREALRQVLDGVYCGCERGGRDLVSVNFCLVHGWRAKDAWALLAESDPEEGGSPEGPAR